MKTIIIQKRAVGKPFRLAYKVGQVVKAEDKLADRLVAAGIATEVPSGVDATDGETEIPEMKHLRTVDHPSDKKSKEEKPKKKGADEVPEYDPASFEASDFSQDELRQIAKKEGLKKWKGSKIEEVLDFLADKFGSSTEVVLPDYDAETFDADDYSDAELLAIAEAEGVTAESASREHLTAALLDKFTD